MRTLPFADMLAHTTTPKQTITEHKANDSGKRVGSIGRLYLDMLESGRPHDWVAQEIHTIAYRRAYRTTTKRPDTLNRPYSGESAEQFATDVAGNVLVRCLSGTPDQVAKVTVRSEIGRVDRANNKATRYWTCLYFVRFNFVVDADGTVIPDIGDWRQVTQTQYKQARRVEATCEESPKWVETMEYRKTVRTLTDADHEDDGYTTKTGDTQVWAAMHSHLTPAEQTVLHLYGMGVKSHVIARAVFGDRMVKGDAAKVRILISRTLAKLAAATGQTEQETNNRPIRRSALAPTR